MEGDTCYPVLTSAFVHEPTSPHTQYIHHTFYHTPHPHQPTHIHIQHTYPTYTHYTCHTHIHRTLTYTLYTSYTHMSYTYIHHAQHIDTCTHSSHIHPYTYHIHPHTNITPTHWYTTLISHIFTYTHTYFTTPYMIHIYTNILPYHTCTFIKEFNPCTCSLTHSSFQCNGYFPKHLYMLNFQILPLTEVSICLSNDRHQAT